MTKSDIDYAFKIGKIDSLGTNDITSYSIIKLPNGVIVFFNSRTVIRGCKMKHLAVGDEVILNKVVYIDKTKNTRIRYAREIQLKSIAKKWNKILCDEGLALIGEGTIIDPEIIKTDYAYSIKPNDREMLDKFLLEYKFKNKTDKKIMELYAEGLSLRKISDIVTTKDRPLMKSQIGNIVKAYFKIMKGE